MTGSLLISGPPGSGKSRLALDRFAATPDAILLTPTATMAEHARHELARAAIPVRPSRIMTLAQFVDMRAAELAPPAPLLNLLIREALDDLRPPRFRNVSEYPGFHRALSELIDEAPASAVPGDIARIFQSVERGLSSRGMALRNARLKSAASNLTALPAHIVLDGFFSFSPSELDLIDAWSKKSRVTITLPAWFGAEMTRARLLGSGLSELVCPAARRTAASSIIAAPTLDREVEEIARRILEHVAAGGCFREIGILLRTREPYAPALETTLARFGIPARFYFVEPLAAHPVIEYFSRLIRAMLQGWDHAALLSALRMPESGLGATPEGDSFDFDLREKLPGTGLPVRGIENPPDVLRALESLSWWRDRVDPASWASRVKTLRSLLPRPAIEEEVHRASIQHLRSTAAALDAFDALLDESAAMLTPAAMALADFWRHIEDALQLTPLRIPDRRRNVVHVMDVFEARQWELPVVFVCGMVERNFPQYHRENPLLDDAARHRAGLKTSADLQREERFLFEIATTRATLRTILSYARFDEKGEQSIRSFFLESAGPDTCEHRIRPRPSRSVPSHGTVWIRGDANAAKLAGIHRRLAATSIESFLQCPFQFFAGKTLRLNPRPPAPRDRLDVRMQGSILHRALAEYSKAPLLGSAILDVVFAEECGRENIPLTYRTEAVRLELLRNFEAFLADRSITLDWPARVEQKFTFELSPRLSITGRIDRLDIGPRNQSLVIDYKYSAGAKIRERVGENANGNLVQGGLYLAAAQRAFGLEPAGMLYCGLRKEVVWDGWHAAIAGLERIGESLTREALQELIDGSIAKASEVFESVTSGRIAPHPEDPKKCVWCDFRDMCRIEVAEISKTAGESPF